MKTKADSIGREQHCDGARAEALQGVGVSMDRRGFLGTLMAGLGALVIKPADGLLWMPTPEAIEVVEPSAILTLNQITMQVLRRVRDGLNVEVPMIVGDKIGHADRGVTLNQQWNIAARMPTELNKTGLALTHVEPIAELFIHKLKSRDIKGCGVLSHPHSVERCCVVRDPRSGLSVRGIQQYDLEEGDYRLRFDMLVAQ